jgi:hypothetical protein
MRKLTTVSGVVLILLHSVSAQRATGPGELVHGIAFASFTPLNRGRARAAPRRRRRHGPAVIEIDTPAVPSQGRGNR